jgi:serine/threonine protein kinase
LYDREFLILNKEAQGGQGRIWGTDEPGVLVKQFEPALISDDPAVQQILREKAERAYKGFCQVNKSQQPELCSLPREFVIVQGNPSYIMRRAEGVPLQSLLRENRIATSQNLPVALALARALAKLHSAQIIHADVHPDNYFVRGGPGGYTAIVLDIDGGGLLSPPGPIYPMSQPKRLYKAPELSQMKWQQLYNRHLAFAPDDWGLAVLLYQLLVDYEGPFCTVKTHPNPAVKNYTPYQQAAYRDRSVRWPAAWQEPLLFQSNLTLNIISLFYATFASRFLLDEKKEVTNERPTASVWEQALCPALPCERSGPVRVSVVMPVTRPSGSKREKNAGLRQSAPPPAPVTLHEAIPQRPVAALPVGEPAAPQTSEAPEISPKLPEDQPQPALPPAEPVPAPPQGEDTARAHVEKIRAAGLPKRRGACGWRTAMKAIVRKLHLRRGGSGNGQSATDAAA